MAFEVPHGSEIGVRVTSIAHGRLEATVGGETVFSSAVPQELQFRPLTEGKIRVGLMLKQEGNGVRTAEVEVVTRAAGVGRLHGYFSLRGNAPAASFEIEVKPAQEQQS